jgi:hypothetical protein
MQEEAAAAAAADPPKMTSSHWSHVAPARCGQQIAAGQSTVCWIMPHCCKNYPNINFYLSIVEDA